MDHPAQAAIRTLMVQISPRIPVWYDGPMRKRVYIETSVVSYLTARSSRDLIVAARQQSTRLMIRHSVENAGYQCPEICSPDELLESET